MKNKKIQNFLEQIELFDNRATLFLYFKNLISFQLIICLVLSFLFGFCNAGNFNNRIVQVNAETPLNVTINQSSTQIDPSASQTVSFTAEFNQAIDVDTFVPNTIVLTGTAPGLSVVSINQVAPNNGTTFDVVVSSTGFGTVIANIPAGNTTPYSSSTFGNTGSKPRGVAIDSTGNIFTSNFNSNNVTKITPTGLSTVFGSTDAGPTEIAIDSAGNIYTPNFNINNVTKITPNGEVTILGTTETNPRSIVIDGVGNIYTANSGSNSVSKITQSGVSTTLGTTGSSPTGITIDSSGNIYTANFDSNDVTKITPSGISSVFGTTGVNPIHIINDPNGNIYTANYGSNNVTKITPAGISSIFGTTNGNPFALIIDPSGNIYSANSSGNSVTQITPAGISTVIGNTDSTPFGISIDSSGNIFTSNNGSDTITKITALSPGIKSAVENQYNTASTSVDNVVYIESGYTFGSYLPQAPLVTRYLDLFPTINLIGANVPDNTLVYATFPECDGFLQGEIIGGNFIPDAAYYFFGCNRNGETGYFRLISDGITSLNIPYRMRPALEDTKMSLSVKNIDETNDLNSCELGILSPNSTSSCSYKLRVDASLLFGYSINVSTSGNLTNGNFDFDNAIQGNTGTIQLNGVNLYGVKVTSFDPGTRVDLNPLYESGVNNIVSFVNTTPEVLVSDGGDGLYSTTTVTHSASIDSATPSGVYIQTVTYTITPNYTNPNQGGGGLQG